ncbi:MAG: YHS domain-containing (seleno)protein [Albidovulum sp.]
MTVTRRAVLAFGLAIPVGGTILRPALAREPEVFATAGVAISGYDAVAYFTEGRPVEGSPAHALKWRGATWQFASDAAMDAFEMNPSAYAPQYGGYCAYAMAKGAVATTVPEAFTINKDRLYLNFSTAVRSIWSEDIPGNVSLADGNWPAALDR